MFKIFSIFKRKTTKNQKYYIIMLIEIYQKQRKQAEVSEAEKKIYLDGMIESMGKIKGACEVIDLRVEFKENTNIVYVYDSKDNLIIKDNTIISK